MKISSLAGKPADTSILIDVTQLVAAYYTGQPDPSQPAQRVVFGTSGHRGCSLDASFNEAHILAITQAICLYRKQQRVDGPLYIGFDTHALSEPAFKSALEVLAANGVDVVVDAENRATPTPVISGSRPRLFWDSLGPLPADGCPDANMTSGEAGRWKTTSTVQFLIRPIGNVKPTN